MSLDLSLAAQRQMIRNQWARDAARLRQPARGHAEAPLQQPTPAPGQLLPDVPADDGEDAWTGPQISGGEQGDHEPARRPVVPQPGARAPWQCPEDLPDGQREVLQLVHRGRIGPGDVLTSRDRDARALLVGHVLEADHRVGAARAGQVMEAAGVSDSATVSQLAPVHVERLLAAADGRLP